jgi:hypothetical protein
MVGQWRSFQKIWFDEFDWLEYSESKDAASCLMICYTEKEIFRKVDNEKIKKRFQEMKKRRMLLPRKEVVHSILF